MLLNTICGAASFKNLRTVDRDKCLNEAKSIQSGKKYITAFTNDILYQVNQETKSSIAFALHDIYVRNSTLHYLELILFKQEASLKNFSNMPIPELLTQQPLQYLKQKAIFDTIVLAIEREEGMHKILAPKNADVDLVNKIVMGLCLSKAYEYLSADAIVKTTE
ncbi:24908_t:CDS:2, partial [Racocetra persica]